MSSSRAKARTWSAEIPAVSQMASTTPATPRIQRVALWIASWRGSAMAPSLARLSEAGVPSAMPAPMAASRPLSSTAPHTEVTATATRAPIASAQICARSRPLEKATK
ncbi:MAG: hypothetical protein QM767_12080 [Anaeromyxobacter sp.]